MMFILNEVASWKGFLFIGAIIWFLYRYIKKSLSFFEQRNVKYMKSMPMLGIIYDMFSRKEPRAVILKEQYDKFKDSKFFGVFEFNNPLYVIKDLKIIKQVLIKDFNSFHDRRMNLNEDSKDIIFSRLVLFLKGQRWRHVRSTISPAFTGFKLRSMFNIITECSHSFMNTLEEMANKAPMEIELKSMFEKYTIDIIAKCVFGVSINSLKNPENEFLKMLQAGTNISKITKLKVMATSAFPKLEKKIGIRLMDEKVADYWFELVSNTVNYRRKNGIVLNDMLNILMQAQESGSISVDDNSAFECTGFATAADYEDNSKSSKMNAKKWDMADIAANCFIFISGGFETISTAIHFLGYELAMNLEIQSKLIQEVDDLNESLKGADPNYEQILSMKYLDMIISEVLRKWPPLAVTDRVCSKSFVLQDNDGTEVLIKPGTGILIPSLAIMRDPQYFPDPDKFDPERFSPENRKNIQEMSYLPFSHGPRNCIGSKFSLVELKTAFYFLLLKFRIEPNQKTESNIKLKPDVFQLGSKNGIFVNLVPRNL